MTYVIATSRKWNIPIAARLEKRLGTPFKLLTEKEQLTLDYLEKISPRYIFFPHWSYVIPEEIFTKFECVIFHMTDVPFGRGGSPLQNLITRGIYETKISALRCVKKLDAGPFYLKKDLCLYGNAEEIFLRAAWIIEKMIAEIVEKKPVPQEQTGNVVSFIRRRPEEGDISNLDSLKKLFDYIRMLDAEGYPEAFLIMDKFKLEFSRASFKHGRILADVKITELKQ